MKLKIRFPKQKKDYKTISRQIRQNKVFKDFVVDKSKDRRELVFNFETKQRYDILKTMLFNTVKNLGYDVEEITE